jgi:hypothetical protein
MLREEQLEVLCDIAQSIAHACYSVSARCSKRRRTRWALDCSLIFSPNWKPIWQPTSAQTPLAVDRLLTHLDPRPSRHVNQVNDFHVVMVFGPVACFIVGGFLVNMRKADLNDWRQFEPSVPPLNR